MMNLLTQQNFAPQRRAGDRRHSTERRRLTVPVVLERREGGERRSGIDRRESPIAHIRNALQILLDIRSRSDDDTIQADVTTIMRRLAYALADLERDRPAR